ncbi:unnamed protein product [Cyprideis torosa]|uniref:Protein disulfide-isomerase n=1 Tax=Cyprideis torosa TaxID=163714 RepID=A0A7R8ZRP7_9CRUS|nr:unnamed protein product [Cyprideis torosa]CAG0899559.1 unnamed protein product [Cyprideis torosa]
MSKLTSCFLISLCAFVVIAKEDDVLVVTDADFKEKLQDKEVALVMFYAPWCGHCKRLKPEYEKAAADLLADEDAPVTLAKADCTDNAEKKCQEFGVSGYPTLKIFRNGVLSQDYQGPREANGIVKYMKAMAGPSAKPIRTSGDLDKFLSVNDVGVVGFFPEDSSLKKTFQTAADSLRENVRFGLVEDASLASDFKNKIVLYRPKILSNKFEEPHSVYEGGENDLGAVKDWISDNFAGLVGYRTSDNGRFFKADNLVVAYYDVDYAKNPKGTNYWRNRILKVASGLRETLASKNVQFAVSGKDDFQHELDSFGITYFKGDKPKVAIMAENGKNKYVMAGEFTVENFEKFLKDWVNGELEPYVKSEPIPEGDSANDGDVLVAVAKNFDALVTNTDRDTLIEFYAPWCGHCKKLAPTYAELASDLKGEEVDIVKFDATANDVPKQYDVTGFPTLYWAPVGSKMSPEKYQGGREKDDFIKYIAKKATKELKNFDREGKKKAKEEL